MTLISYTRNIEGYPLHAGFNASHIHSYQFTLHNPNVDKSWGYMLADSIQDYAIVGATTHDLHVLGLG
jgi:hypothetical protein